jgi:hypothetical protein
MRRYLVVANRTLLGAHLLERITGCRDAGECSFHLVVPASPPEDSLVFTEGLSRAHAQERLDEALAVLRERGVEAIGEVGDRDPVNAVLDVLNTGREVDEVILSTLPAGPSRWLHQDVPHRLSRAVELPITHVTPDTLHIGG